MNEPKQDRRIRRTQKLLKNSLIDLMQEKEFKNITVKDITELADLNRGTFYLHYNDTYHLLQTIEDEVLSNFQQMINAYTPSSQNKTILSMLYPIISYIGDNTALCKILFENNASVNFIDRFHRLIRQNGSEIISAMFPQEDESINDYFFEFITYGLIGVLKGWIDSGQKLPQKTLAEQIDKAVMGTAERLFGTT